MSKKPLVFTITGKSASGKTSLEAALQATGLFGKAISHTTRPPRAGEKHGVDYYFVTDEMFNNLTMAGYMIEHVKFGDYQYGISIGEANRLNELGLPIVIVCEPQGRNQIVEFCKQKRWGCISVLTTASVETIMHRFVKRFMHDMDRSGDSAGDRRKLEHAYTNRLKQMVTVELGWTKEEFGYAKSFWLESIEVQNYAVKWFTQTIEEHGFNTVVPVQKTA